MSRHNLDDLLRLMEKLRHPEHGCIWDRQQTFKTIAPYTVEEAYEVAEVIDHQDYQALKDELGDLLFQVVFHAQMAREQKLFDFADVVNAITEKMIRRHPHVFGDEHVDSVAEQKQRWEDIKREENPHKGVLDGVPGNLPALNRAYKLQKKAANVGFDWPDISGVYEKLQEELDELKAADPQDIVHLEEEMGDVLFSLVNLSRHLKVDPDAGLRRANRKFLSRFAHIEAKVQASGKPWRQWSLDEMEAAWQDAKSKEK